MTCLTMHHIHTHIHAVAEDSFQQIQSGQARRIEDSHLRVENVHQSLVLLDAEHSALLVHHKGLSEQHANGEKTFFSAVDQLVSVIDALQVSICEYEYAITHVPIISIVPYTYHTNNDLPASHIHTYIHTYTYIHTHRAG